MESMPCQLNLERIFFDIKKDVLSLVDDIEEIDRYFEKSDGKLTDDLLELMDFLGYDTTHIAIIGIERV
jgi:hypothetical protein